MAVVHPSRMNLVPVDRRDKDRISGERREPARSRRSPNRDDERGYDRNPNGEPRRERDRRTSRSRSQSRSRSRSRSRERTTRRSPEYEDYRGREPERGGENGSGVNQGGGGGGGRMYPPRQYGHGGANFTGGGGQGADFFESRRLQREASTLTIWPPSPKAPKRNLSPDDAPREKHKSDKSRKHKHKDRKKSRSRSRSRSPARSDDSHDRDRDRDRRRRKDHRRRRRTRSPSTSPSEESDPHERKRRRRDKGKERDETERVRDSGEKQARGTEQDMDEDDWIEKEAPSKTFIAEFSHTSAKPPSNPSNPPPDPDSDSDSVGPQPLTRASGGTKIDERTYGTQLLRGEGSAMAAFLSSDPSARIPRRGEIGLSSGEIATYEDSGYVMSGSRHRRMNAVRIRKENQVISAEEKRGILKLQKEERERREMILREEFKELVKERLKGDEGKREGPGA